MNTLDCKLDINIERICNSGIDLDPFSYDFVPGYPTLDFLSTQMFNNEQTNLLFEFSKPVGIYIHIPFCNYFCDYCYFIKHKFNSEIVEKYVESVIKELEIYSRNLIGKEINFCYLGGGTPTSIPDDLLREIIQFIYRNFSISDNFEFTCEASPNTLNEDLIRKMNLEGITRISVGIQSFNSDILKSMGRRYNLADVEKVTGHLHKYFSESFNYDFIFGYHLHNLDTVKEDVDLVAKLGIPSATFYQIWLERETNVKQKIETLDYSDIYNQRALINDILTENGYVNDKSDWFIKTNKAKYRFQDHKWKNGFFLGVGINSYGFVNNIAYRNYLDLTTYLKHNFSTLPINNFYKLTEEDLQKREVCLRVKIEEGINLKRIKYPNLNNKIQELVNLDLAKNKYGIVKLNEKGLCITEYISNYLIQ